MLLTQHPSLRLQHAAPRAGVSLPHSASLSLSLRSPAQLLRQCADVRSSPVIAVGSSLPLRSDRRIICKAGSHAGHAFLHDFCMAIPYGAIAMLAAVVLVALGAKETAAPLAIGGFVVAAAAGMSLKNWKAKQQSTPYTLVSAGTSSYVGYVCWTSLQTGVVPWLTGIVAALSGGYAVFAVYNVLAGGNPPAKGK